MRLIFGGPIRCGWSTFAEISRGWFVRLSTSLPDLRWVANTNEYLQNNYGKIFLFQGFHGHTQPETIHSPNPPNPYIKTKNIF